MSSDEKLMAAYQKIIEDITLEPLSDTWDFKIDRFSDKKILYDYQKNALNSALKLLYYFYANLMEYPKKSSEKDILEVKKKLFNDLKKHIRHIDELGIDNKNNKLFSIASRYYEETGKKIPFYNFTNRMGFWMATGSGKSLVIVKLIEILYKLKERGLIPDNDILFLTYREDLMDQIKKHIDEFNSYSSLKIRFWDLKEYDNVKHNLLFNRDDINLFIYRSDLVSDTSSEKLLSFEDIENNGKWYIILDEAHKGNKEDSKRQVFYSILSRLGFLFNFSATFTDPWDIITTVFNLNLEPFIKKGYGKNVYVSKQSLEVFKTSDDNADKEERKKVVMKTLLTLAMVKKAHASISEIYANAYHNPMMVLYGNTTNVENSDLQIFFEILGEIALGMMSGELFETIKNSVLDEFENNPEFVFGDQRLPQNMEQIADLDFSDVLKFVYNSDTPGKIEVIKTRANKEELAFKLKTSDKYFASMKIGDISKWLKETLSEYEISESPVDSSFFEKINSPESSINILMGSRAFYEGWDSNRPNVMVFINIGTGDARKYIIQSIGRGVRIEPLANRRQRIQTLSKNGDAEAKQLLSLIVEKKAENLASLLETLFIFGTNGQNLKEIMESIKFERQKAGELIDVRKNDFDFKPTLLLPVYKEIEDVRITDLPRFPGNFNLLNNYCKWLDDDRILYAIHSDETEPRVLEKLHVYLSSGDNFKNDDSGNALNQMQRLLDHLNMSLKEMDRFKEIEDEIVHFKEISVEIVSDEKKKELSEKIEKIRKFKNPEVLKKELKMQFESKQIDLDEYTRQIEKLSKVEKKALFDYDESKIELINLAQHYYLPVILSASEKADFINHVIKVPSEKKFIHDLDSFINSDQVKNIDWWAFSKIDESLDKVSIPYFDGHRMRDYSPDFIFWIKQGSNYKIVFVDPKSSKYSDYQKKIDYFKKLFEEEDKPKDFKYRDFTIRVYLFMKTDDINDVGEGYKRYWMEDLKKIFTI